MSQYYESSKYISNLFFVMPYTYILDDSIKSPTVILTADHSTLLYISPSFFFLQNKELLFFFCGWNSKWSRSRTHICMTLPLLSAHFSWPLPFLQSQKVATLPLFPPPPPMLISDKSQRFVLFSLFGQINMCFQYGNLFFTTYCDLHFELIYYCIFITNTSFIPFWILFLFD